MMANQRGSVSKLPLSWWGLFVAFRSGRKPLVSAECWWRDAVMSHYGEKPSWEDLMVFLIKTTEPQINDENKLIFVPAFFGLDNDFQRLLLSFLIHHKSELPVVMARQLVSDLEKHLSPRCQPWIVSLLNSLKNSLIDPLFSESYKFSENNQVSLASLIALLQDPTENPFLPSTNFEGKSRESTVSVFKSSSSLYSNDDDVQIIDISEDMPQDKVFPPAEEEMRSVEQESENVKETLENDCLELSLEIQQQVTHLHFLLHRTDDVQTATLPTEIQLLITCSSKQLQQICNQLELEILTESAFSILCRYLVEIGNDISYENCLLLAKICIQPKFFTQSRKMSRTLTASLISFTKKFPKVFIDGVLVPSAVAKKLDLPQAELVNQLIKEVFSINHKIYLLQQLSQELPPLEVGIISLLESLLDGKLEISIELSQLIAWFRKSTTPELDSNSKYGRFILMFVKKHKKQLTTTDVNNLHQIMENHKTFIKKALLNELKGLT